MMGLCGFAIMACFGMALRSDHNMGLTQLRAFACVRLRGASMTFPVSKSFLVLQ